MTDNNRVLLRTLLSDDLNKRIDDYLSRFDAALGDDLNTPKALAIMHELSTEINKTDHPIDKLGLQETLKYFMTYMGFIT